VTAKVRCKVVRKVHGYTLLEVVVAMAVFSLTAAVVYQSIGWSLRRSAEVRQRTYALLTAQSILSRLRTQSVTQVESLQGEDNGLRWQAELRPLAPQPDASIVAVNLSVTVQWGGPLQSIRLQSVELMGRLP
jgi:type II secretion system protein I